MTCWPSNSRSDFSEYAPASPWKHTRIGLMFDVSPLVVFVAVDDGDMAPPLNDNMLDTPAVVEGERCGDVIEVDSMMDRSPQGRRRELEFD